MIVGLGPPSSYTPWTKRICKDEPSVNFEVQEFQHVSSIIELTALRNRESRELGFAGKDTVVFIGDNNTELNSKSNGFPEKKNMNVMLILKLVVSKECLPSPFACKTPAIMIHKKVLGSETI